VLNSIKDVRRIRGDGPVTVLVLGAANRSVQQLSDWLLKQTPKADFPIKHDVWLDSGEITCAWYVLLSALAAGRQSSNDDIATILARLSDLRRCEGTKSSLEDSDKILAWRSEVLMGKRPRSAPLIAQLDAIVQRCGTEAWSGDVIADCDRLIGIISSATDKRITCTRELCAIRRPFRRGETTCAVVEKLFREQGHYVGAIQHFQRAAQHDRLTDRFVSLLGCNVMTLHKCKGKEFDAVVIVDGLKEPHRLVCRGDQDPFERSRRLLRVGITRARYRATILTPKTDVSPLLPR
jgi:DNA helicase-2/ATP-dependent DNA helicase PcrA